MSEVRLIDANALKKDIDTSLLYGLCVCFDEIVERQPTIEAGPVRHGRWEDCSNGWMCSECTVDSEKDYNFCPNCGARMDANERMFTDSFSQMAEAVQLIENETTAFCMTPCSERMPDKDGKYLVLLNNNAWDILEYDTELKQFGWTDDYKDEFGYNITEWYDSTKMVVSWMPLPDNPEDSNHE